MPDGFVGTTTFCRDAACLVEWVDHWQTLVGAAIAIPFAAFAILVPIFQESGRLRRRSDALRASLPVRLSEVLSYAAKALKEVAACRTSSGVDAAALSWFSRPEVPQTIVFELERTIEALNNKRVARRLGRIIEQIQVLDSRLADIGPSTWDGSWLDALLIQAGTIHAQAESLFDYARQRKPSAVRHLLWTDVSKALILVNLDDLTHPDAIETLARYAKSRVSPEGEALPRWQSDPMVKRLRALVKLIRIR